jgi:acyl carrier protein
MKREEVVRNLQAYFVREILEGNEADLDEESPLLEWGLLNSLEIIRLLRFVREEFGVRLEQRQVAPNTFKDIRSIANLIVHSASGETHGDHE